ncbi:uncharacterized protein LOC134541259 [Bacillus rossius redtenbacheri]|uniref:uncharacterized protein LOC134541259 n=1 Tax=Bacillus rossius redtenbacheri TaxID=93214 RepID=UPI002FDD0564
MVKQEPSEIVFPLIKEESENELPADGDVCVKQEPSELGFPPIKEELDEPPADGDVCVKQEPSELGFPPIKEELDEPPADGDVCVKQEPSELEELDEPPADGDVCAKQEPSELGFPPIKEELDEPSSGAGVTWLVVVLQCEDSWQPEPCSSSASQDYTLCKQQVKEEITIEEHPIAAAVAVAVAVQIHNFYSGCSVPDCRVYPGKNVSMHRFPKDAKLRRRWAHVLRIGKPVTNYMYVCQHHFTKEDIFYRATGKDRILMASGNNSVCSFQNSAPEMNDQQVICTRRQNLTEIQPTLKKNSKDVSRGWRKKELHQRRLLNTIAPKAANEDLMVKKEPSEIVFPLIKEELVNELPADGDVCVKQEPSELGFPPIKEELDEPPADADLCVKQEPSELGFPPIKEELDEPPADGDVCVKQEPSELGFPPIKEELDEPCEDSWQPEPGSSSASQDYTLCKQQVKEEITIEEHPIAADFAIKTQAS